MFKSPTIRRARSIALALLLTLVTNYAISYALASENQPTNGGTPRPAAGVLENQPTNGGTPRP